MNIKNIWNCQLGGYWVPNPLLKGSNNGGFFQPQRQGANGDSLHDNARDLPQSEAPGEIPEIRENPTAWDGGVAEKIL